MLLIVKYSHFTPDSHSGQEAEGSKAQAPAAAAASQPPQQQPANRHRSSGQPPPKPPPLLLALEAFHRVGCGGAPALEGDGEQRNARNDEEGHHENPPRDGGLVRKIVEPTLNQEVG